MVPQRFANFAEHLTSALFVAPGASYNRSARARKLFLAGVLAVCSLPSVSPAETSTTPSATNAGAGRTRRTATIHWERVPLHEALGRLAKLFDEAIFIDRRVDPSQRVSLNIDSAALDEVLTA